MIPRADTWHGRVRRRTTVNEEEAKKPFAPLRFVAPPYLFPAYDEVGTIGQEVERRRLSTLRRSTLRSGSRRKSKVSPFDEAVEEESESGSSDREDSLEEEKLPKLTKRQIWTIVMLAFVNFCSTVVFSCIAPFFPDEARKKGTSQQVVGFIFGVFELVIFLVSPFYGRYMTHIGSKNMYTGGLLVTGATSIFFGLLKLLPDGNVFIGMCFAVRILEACSDAAFMTASFAIIVHQFPGRTSTIIGVLETFSSLGFTVGPPIGGALYQLGGYQTPFIVLGVLLIVAGILAVIFIPKQDDAPRHNVGGVLGLFRYPAVFLFMFAIIVTAVCLSFIDPTFQSHLEQFNMSPLLVGFMFLIIGGVHTMTAPLWGYFVDRTSFSRDYTQIREVMIVGALLSTVAMFFLGPSPVVHLEKTLWIIIVAEVILGLGLGALFIPTFHNVLTVAREKGYPESFETYGLVSGLFQSSFSFGGFFGPTIFGGVVVEAIGFSWTATILAGLNLLVAILMIFYQIHGRFISKKQDYSMLEESSDEEKGKHSPDSGMGHESMEK